MIVNRYKFEQRNPYDEVAESEINASNQGRKLQISIVEERQRKRSETVERKSNKQFLV